MGGEHAVDEASDGNHARAHHEAPAARVAVMSDAHARAGTDLAPQDSHGQQTDLPACASMSHCSASLPGVGTPAAPRSGPFHASAASAPVGQPHAASLKHLTPPPRA